MPLKSLAVGVALLVSGALAAPYTVQPGDTLFNIAKRFNTTVAALQQLNHLTGTDLKTGQVLEVPGAPAPTTAYTVQPGDTLYSIAKRFNTTVTAVQTANGLQTAGVKTGQVLVIPAGATPAAAAAVAPPAATATTAPAAAAPALTPPTVSAADPSPATPPGPPTLPPGTAALPNLTRLPASTLAAPPAPLTHTVAPGENLYRISLRYGTTTAALQAANRLETDGVRAGQVLVIPVPAATAAPAAASVPAPADVRAVAARYLGVPYRLGGTDPATGLDCSGFTSVVFAALGVRLPRTSAEQYATGDPVDTSDLQPGDLVFFDTTGEGVSHVGIYLGDGSFVHAATFPPRVTTSRLDEVYYATRYLGARRVLHAP